MTHDSERIKKLKARLKGCLISSGKRKRDLKGEVSSLRDKIERLEKECAELRAEVERLRKAIYPNGLWEKFAEAQKEIERLSEGLGKVRKLVDAQAEDEGLWFMAKYASEAYLQQELRKLHSAVEALAILNERVK